jgi:hypothetical protein
MISLEHTAIRSSIGAFLMVVGVLDCAALFAQTGQSQLDATQLSQQSTFVFNGTVKKLNATTMPQLPAAESTAVVTVDAVQRCTTSLCGLAKSDVTVDLSSPLKVGDQATFFTQGWLLGSGVAVKEVKHVSPPLSDQEVNNILAQGSKALTEKALRDQLAAALCVITGQVEAVMPVKTLAPQPGEHDPKWQDAKIRILSVEKKGCLGPAAKTVDVVFPTSKDIVWVNSPRFREGQQGVWILNPIPGGKFKAFAAPSPNTYTSLRDQDFKGLDKIDAIRAILKENGAK